MIEAENEQLTLPKRPGRPTKFNDAAIDQICVAFTREAVDRAD